MTQSNALAVSISEAVRIVGLGRTPLYAAIAAGTLKTRKAGRRTLIETAELTRFVKSLPSSSSHNAV